MSELKTLQHVLVLDINDEKVEIKPIPFGKLFEALSLLTAIFENANIGYESLSSDTSMISKILMSGGEEVYKFLSLASGKDREWFNGISSADGILLATKVLELNSDFFVQQALPILRESFTKIKAMKDMVV